MKIRYRITLWITGVGLFVGLLFTAVVLWELAEQPNELIDAELNSVAGRIATQLDLGSVKDAESFQSMMPLANRYWIRTFDNQGKVLFQSSFAQSHQSATRPARMLEVSSSAPGHRRCNLCRILATLLASTGLSKMNSTVSNEA